MNRSRTSTLCHFTYEYFNFKLENGSGQCDSCTLYKFVFDDRNNTGNNGTFKMQIYENIIGLCAKLVDIPNSDAHSARKYFLFPFCSLPETLI